MEPSIWNETLGLLREQVGGTEPVPAGVSISAVIASLALALLAKVLDITAKRKNFTGDRESIDTLIAAARMESTRLTQFADDDVQAFNQYLEAVRGGESDAIGAATRQTIDVPMNAARAAVRGLELCAEGVNLVHGLTAADLGIAAALLSGAVRGMLISVDSNIHEMHSDQKPSAAVRELESKALQYAEAVTAALSR
jgi:formiminotetrahydrofolate cyclodeaminase